MFSLVGPFFGSSKSHTSRKIRFKKCQDGFRIYLVFDVVFTSSVIVQLQQWLLVQWSICFSGRARIVTGKSLPSSQARQWHGPRRSSPRQQWRPFVQHSVPPAIDEGDERLEGHERVRRQGGAGLHRNPLPLDRLRQRLRHARSTCQGKLTRFVVEAYFCLSFM